MKLLATLFMLLVIGLAMAVPVSCVMDSMEQAREKRARYGSDVERMNRAIKELDRIKARQAWERAQMERIKKEMPR